MPLIFESALLTVLKEFCDVIVGGITSLAEGIGKGLQSTALNAFFTYTTDSSSGATTITGLSTFGGIVAIFAGISLAIGLTTMVVTMIRKMGN